MATNRTPISRNTKRRITPDIIECYRRMRELYDDPRKSEECIMANRQLTNLLEYPVWQATTILEVIDEEGGPPDYICRQGTFRIQEWFDARELRRQLDAS
jgi:hypothetical protein